ncbi:TA system toxin CbtA family protein [Duganella vulcania]|uniref:Uncharacterized protein n=1 Tax=Duganella vulcania TaxID=2692166 RepID=A0A845GHB6_9BURK|nr:TA system toxin CbtA family protein [Duganella vulcania]MYM92686.1 hypothetical protein [Duganella vulcania]
MQSSQLQQNAMTVQRFQAIATELLTKHYGLALNDTQLCEDHVVQQCIGQGYLPYQVVTEHAQEADLDRIDKSAGYGVASKAPLTASDEQDAIARLTQQGSTTAAGLATSAHHQLAAVQQSSAGLPETTLPQSTVAKDLSLAFARWTPEMDTAALKEGWLLSETSDMTIQCQRVDCPDDHEELGLDFTVPQLSGDEEAHRIVREGNEAHHRMARAILKEYSYTEYWQLQNPVNPADVAEWVGLHYKVNYDAEPVPKQAYWRDRYIQAQAQAAQLLEQD